ncbi:MAG: endonuclease/exonuclease/phosphatase family protein [Flavobacteriaceae bacterium]
MKRLNIFDKLIFLLNSVAATLLVLSYGLPYLPPKTFSFLSVLSLTVPFLLALNLGFGLYWIIRLKRHFILSLLVLLMGLNHIKSTYSFKTISSTEPKNDLKIMSYNVRLLNYYDWIDSEEIPEQIKQFIDSKSPDILCVQEYQSSIAKTISLPFSFRSPKGLKSELVIFSKYQPIKTGIISFPNSANSALFADFKVQSYTLRVYNIHLQSSGVNTNIDHFDSESSDKMINQLSSTFVMQQQQADLVVSHMTQSPYPILLCGDFNNTPYSYIYRQIKSGLKDAFEEAGNGFGQTYSMNYYPARIDFIMVDSTITVNEFTTHNEEFSDHFPISASLNLNN